MSITEIWADTGTVIQRDPTPEEIAQQAADQAAAEAAAQAAAEVQAEREAARASAVGKLKKLGLTDAEINGLLSV